MSFILNHYAFERIRQNGTLITHLPCCDSAITPWHQKCLNCDDKPFVTLCGIHNQQKQTWQWHIFIGEPEGEPITTLTCADCGKEVKKKNRQCECDAYCYLRMEWYNGQFELHRDVAMEPEPDSDGIVIQTQTAEPNSPTHVVPLDFSQYDLELGGLYCPFGHGFSYNGMPNVDEHARCRGHHVQLSAVLVLKKEGIFVERRAHNFNTGEEREIPPDKIRIAQLKCPDCEKPIIEKTLLCSHCQTYIVDVVQKPSVERHRPVGVGTDIHTIIAIEPRWAWDTTRPDNAIVMEGENWKEPEQPQAPPETETPAPEHKSHKAIYAEYLEIKEKDPDVSIRRAAESIGIKHPKLQYVLKKMEKEIAAAAAARPLDKYEAAQRKWEEEREQEKLKQQQKPPKWFS